MTHDEGLSLLPELGWVNGWVRTRRGFEFEGVVRRGGEWVSQTVPAAWLVHARGAFEPSIKPLDRLPSRSLNLRIPDLAKLSPVMDPGCVLGAMVSGARRTRHAIYAVADNERTVYLPASLLIRELWLWSGSVLEALLTPGSLALYLQCSTTDKPLRIEATGPLARARQSDTALRRLCWLAQSSSARASWSSVLTHAHRGDLRLKLPSASLEAWAWGVELPAGTLVAQLSAVKLRFDLPQEDCWVKLGQTDRPCPPAQSRRGGLVSF